MCAAYTVDCGMHKIAGCTCSTWMFCLQANNLYHAETSGNCLPPSLQRISGTRSACSAIMPRVPPAMP